LTTRSGKQRAPQTLGELLAAVPENEVVWFDGRVWNARHLRSVSSEWADRDAYLTDALSIKFCPTSDGAEPVKYATIRRPERESGER
jgi:hypothetical protein